MIQSAMHARFLAACGIAREAGDLMRRRFAEPRELRFKSPQDYLSAVDTEVETLVAGGLRRAFPGDAVIGEEGGGTAGDLTWVIDPIDGTANFVRGLNHFCVSIALVFEGRTEIGVIYAPITDELFAARRGAGATLNGVAMQASRLDDLRLCQVELGWSPRRPMADYIAMLERVNRTGASFRRAGSGALGIAYVAAGRQDGYCELHINSWDCLAGLVMVEEAGGWTNDFLAGDGLMRGNAVLACGSGVRDALIAATGIE